MVDKWAWCTVLLYWLDTNLCHLEQMRINHLFPLIFSTLRCVQGTLAAKAASVLIETTCFVPKTPVPAPANEIWAEKRSKQPMRGAKSVAVWSLALASGFMYVGRRWQRKSRNAPSRWKCLKQNGIDSVVCPCKGDVIYPTSKRAMENQQNKPALSQRLSFRNISWNISWEGALH